MKTGCQGAFNLYHIIICDDENTFIQYIQSVILKCDICEEEVIFHKYNSEDMLMHDINMIPRCDLVILNVKDSEIYIAGYYYYTFVRVKSSKILYIENCKRESIIHVNREKMELDINKITTNKKIAQL